LHATGRPSGSPRCAMGVELSRALAGVASRDLAVQLGCGAAAIALRTERFYDFSASCTYVYLVLQSLAANAKQWPPTALSRPVVNSGLVLVWASRLGTFLLRRIMEDGKDSRFDKVRDKPRAFMVFWLVQAAWIFLTAMPVWVVNCKQSERKGKDEEDPDEQLTVQDKLGWSLWFVGFVMQVVADRQKTAFKRREGTRGKFINEGLWSLAQHPNYGGEIAMWGGIFLSCCSRMRGKEMLLSSVSPLFVYYLLTRVSGIPLQRRANLRKWGKDPAFLKYISETPLLWPFVRLP